MTLHSHKLLKCNAMVAAMIKATQTDLGEYIRAYRMCLLYGISKHIDKLTAIKMLEDHNLSMTDDQFLKLTKTLKENYESYKDLEYKGFKIFDWCSGLNGGLIIDEPLANRWESFPLAARAAVSEYTRGSKYKAPNPGKPRMMSSLKDILGEKPFEDFEWFINTNQTDTIKYASLIDKAYMLFLMNAKQYYYPDEVSTLDHSDLKTNDYQWDWLSKNLASIKHKLNPARYPVLFDERFEAGQSLFWLEQNSYPDNLNVM